MNMISGITNVTAISLSCFGMLYTLLVSILVFCDLKSYKIFHSQFTVVNIELVAGGREYEIHFKDKFMGPLIIYFDIINLYTDHLVLYRAVVKFIDEKTDGNIFLSFFFFDKIK